MSWKFLNRRNPAAGSRKSLDEPEEVSSDGAPLQLHGSLEDSDENSDASPDDGDSNEPTWSEISGGPNRQKRSPSRDGAQIEDDSDRGSLPQRVINRIDRAVNEVNRLRLGIERDFESGVRRGLHGAYLIGVEVRKVQDSAPKKMKTFAVKALASHPDIQLSQSHLYRFLKIANELPKRLGVDPAVFLTCEKNRTEFERLVGGLSLADAMTLIFGPRGKPNGTKMLEEPKESKESKSPDGPKGSEEPENGRFRIDGSDSMPTTRTKSPRDESLDGSFIELEGLDSDQGLSANRNLTAAPNQGECNNEVLLHPAFEEGPLADKVESEPSSAVHVRKDIAPEKEQEIEPSLHLYCSSSTLPDAIWELSRRGFPYRSTHVGTATEPDGRVKLAFLVNGGAPESEELGSWMAADKCLLDEMKDRVSAIWPKNSVFEIFQKKGGA